MRNTCSFVAAALALITTISARGADPAEVDALWKKLQAKDESARTRLIELGPETRQLARLILAPRDPASPKVDEELEWGVLMSMNADGASAMAEALKTYREEEDRLTLLYHLEKLGPRSKPAANALLKFALLEEGRVRLEALRVLASARAKPEYVVPELARLSLLPDAQLKEWLPSLHVEYTGSHVLQILGKYPGQTTEETLIHLSRYHPDGQRRESALDALAEYPDPDADNTSVFIERLNDHEAHSFGIGASSVADRALYRLRFHHEVLPEEVLCDLVQVLYRASYERDQNWWPPTVVDAICRCPVTDDVARTLVHEKLRPLLKPEAYITGKADDKRRMRVAAATVVLHCNPKDREAAEFLIKIATIADIGDLRGPFGGALGSRLADVRAEAVRGLAQGGKESAQWVPQIHKILLREIKADTSSELAFDSAWFMAQQVPDNQDCMDVLAHAADDFINERYISWRQVETVLGPRAARMLPKEDVEDFLLKPEDHIYEHEDWNWQAMRAHQARAVPAFLERLKSGSITQRRGAIYGLGQMQVAADRVIPELIAALKDPRATIRAAAAEALTKFGSAANAALPALNGLLKDDYLTVQYAAQEAIAAIAPLEE